MDQLHEQILVLERKVDLVYQIVENLSRQVSEHYGNQNASTAFAPDVAAAPRNPESDTDDAGLLAKDHPANGLAGFMEHKDVLLDTSEVVSPANQTQTQPVSPDIQIRRLNTQLTAAYNRIAALEEQLLARRVVKTSSVVPQDNSHL